MPMPESNNKTLSLRDATTGKEVRVIVTETGKMFQVEGLSHEQIKTARKVSIAQNGCPKANAPCKK